MDPVYGHGATYEDTYTQVYQSSPNFHLNAEEFRQLRSTINPLSPSDNNSTKREKWSTHDVHLVCILN